MLQDIPVCFQRFPNTPGSSMQHGCDTHHVFSSRSVAATHTRHALLNQTRQQQQCPCKPRVPNALDLAGFEVWDFRSGCATCEVGKASPCTPGLASIRADVRGQSPPLSTFCWDFPRPLPSAPELGLFPLHASHRRWLGVFLTYAAALPPLVGSAS